RHNLARDIFARLILATGAYAQVFTQDTGTYRAGDVLVPAGLTEANPEFQALRYLAQVAVNIVDSIDEDDVSTPFVWNPQDGSGNPLPLQQITDPAVLSGPVFATHF